MCYRERNGKSRSQEAQGREHTPYGEAPSPHYCLQCIPFSSYQFPIDQELIILIYCFCYYFDFGCLILVNLGYICLGEDADFPLYFHLETLDGFGFHLYSLFHSLSTTCCNGKTFLWRWWGASWWWVWYEHRWNLWVCESFSLLFILSILADCLLDDVDYFITALFNSN